MTDAEKKWEEWDSQRALAFDLDPDCTIEQLCKDSREAVKESLRLAIEEQRSGFPSKNHFLFTAKEVLDLINSVTPKE